MVFLRALSPFSVQNPSPGNGSTQGRQVFPPQFNLIRIILGKHTQRLVSQLLHLTMLTGEII